MLRRPPLQMESDPDVLAPQMTESEVFEPQRQPLFLPRARRCGPAAAQTRSRGRLNLSFIHECDGSFAAAA